MTVVRRLLFTIALLALGWPALRGDEKKKDETIPDQVSYYKHVRPIFQQHCQGCHQPAKPQGGYVMTGYADLLKKGDHEQPGVVPGKPADSLVVEQIAAKAGKKPAMPKGKDALSPREVEIITKWIAQGAKDDTPASARDTVDAEHPPVYTLPPVLTSPLGQAISKSSIFVRLPRPNRMRGSLADM